LGVIAMRIHNIIFSMRDSVVRKVAPAINFRKKDIFRTDVSMINSMNGRLHTGSDLSPMSDHEQTDHAETIHSHWSTKAKTECPSKAEHHILT